jgi:DNA-binding transcriptional MerR regulator
MKESKPRQPIRSRVYYSERRKKVAEMRALGMPYETIAKQIEVHGFTRIESSQACRDHQQYLAETRDYLQTQEHKAELIQKLETLFSLALKSYNEAMRVGKDGRRVPDPYAQGVLLQRAIEIVERLAELCGFLGRHGIAVTQTVQAHQNMASFDDVVHMVRKLRAQKELSSSEQQEPPSDKDQGAT